MKWVWILCLILSPKVFAENINVTFEPNSSLPPEVQEEVRGVIQDKCPKIQLKGWPVYEESSRIFSDDTSAKDMRYMSLLRVDGMDEDGYHPVTYTLTVYATQFVMQANSVPEISIDKIESDICKN